MHSLQKRQEKETSLLFNVDTPHTEKLFNPNVIHLFIWAISQTCKLHQYLQMLNIVRALQNLDELENTKLFVQNDSSVRVFLFCYLSVCVCACACTWFRSVLLKVSSYLPAVIRLKIPLVWPVNRLKQFVWAGWREEGSSAKVSKKRFINIHHTLSINILHTYQNDEKTMVSVAWLEHLAVNLTFILTPVHDRVHKEMVTFANWVDLLK